MATRKNLRRRLSAALVITLLSLAAVAALSADVAAAARYTVAQCGWHVGHDAAWFDTSANKFVRSSYCRTPQSASGFDGVHLTSETRGSTRTVGGTRFARWRWQAPSGTGIVTVHGHRWQILHDNFRHRIGSVRPSGGFTPFTEFKTTDTVRRDFNRAFSPHATAIESRLLCARPSDRVCDASKRSLAGVRALTITVDDSIRPTSSVSGGLTGSGWLRGIQALSFSDRDAGSGLRYAQTSIDGAVRGHTELACGKALIAGQWRATRMRPCPTTGSGGHSIATATLGDGPHRLRHCGVDFAGNSGCAADRTIRVDNNPPAAPRSLAVTGGGDWRKSNGFDLTWTDPGQGAAAPIVAHRFRVTGPVGFDTGPGSFDTGPLSGFGSGSITGALVPESGEYRISVWLIDAAGNQTETASASATLRLDDLPPSGYFTEPDPERPEIVRVPVADTHSGPASGVIGYRRQGAAGWHELPTSIAGSGSSKQLIARFPGDDLDPGVYEFRARIVDRAGNTAVTSARGNGSPMTLSAPRRTPTVLSAGLSAPATNRSGNGAGRSARRADHGARRAERSSRNGLTVRVPFGRMARLSGRLTTAGGDPLSSQSVVVTETPAFGARAGVSVTTVRTGGNGGFRLELPRGTSRTVAVKFRGGERYGDSSVGPLDLQVAGSVRFRARPRRLKTGRRVGLRGRVRTGAARTPGRGNLVAIQYLERAAKRWRPVLVTRTDRRGRFRAGYRFRYITGRARIRLRAVLLDSQYFPYATARSRPVTVRVRGPAR